MDSINKFQTALNFAKQNPDDPRSVELRGRIEQGVYNDELKALGKPTFQDGQRIDPTMMDTVTNRAKQTVAHPVEAGKGFLKSAGRTVQAIGGFVNDVAMGTAGRAEQLATGKPLEETWAAQPGAGIDVLSQGTEDYNAVDKFLQPTNEAQAGGGNLETAAELYYSGGKQILKKGAGLLKEGAEAAMNTKTGAKATELVGEAYDTGKNVLSKMKPKGVISGKTPEQIMATAPEKLSTLTPSERAYWESKNTEAITKTAEESVSKIKSQMSKANEEIAARHAAEMKATDDEIKNLQYQATKATIAEAESLKPKLVETLRKNSQVFSDMVSEQINPVKDTYIEGKDIISKVREIFPSDPYSVDPEKANRFIQMLGLEEGKTIKVGELYDKIKEIRSGLSKASKGGSKTMTAQDLEKSEMTYALTSTLEDLGVDMSKANQFWAKNADARDKLVSAIQPFAKNIGLEKPAFKTFTEKIASTFGEPDPHNERYIKATEDYLGIKIGNDATRKAFEALSDAQKTKLAKALDNDAVLKELKAGAEEAMSAVGQKVEGSKEAIKSIRFTAEQKAEQKAKIVKRFLQILTGLGISAGAAAGIKTIVE